MDGESLGRKRASGVEKLLMEYGVVREQLEVVAFGAGGDKNPEPRVVISVK